MKLPKLPVLSVVDLIALSVSLILFSIGAALTWTSPVLPKLLNHTDDFFEAPINQEQASWIASWLTVGMLIGSIIYGYLSKVIGRKTCFFTIPIPLIICYVIMAFVNVIELYYFARFLAGISVAGSLISLNLYMSEVIPKSKRGSIIGQVANVSVLGFIYSYTVGPYVSIRTFNITLLIFPSLFLVSFFLVGVETPHYYISKGDKVMARKVLLKLRGKEDNIEEELIEIEKKVMETDKKKLIDMLKLMPTKIGFVNAFGLQFFQQLTGIYCIQFYNQHIFEMTGSSLKPEVCSIIIGTLQFISGVSSSFVMERFTRKSLLYFSALGIVVSEIPLGIYCYLQIHGSDMGSLNFLPLLLMSTFILTYNAGFGPMTIIIPSEVFPTACKGFAMSIVTILNATLTFLLSKYFQSLVDAMGIGILFLVFASFSIISIPFVKFFVVETRGKSLEEIQDELLKKKSFIM